MNYRSGSSLFPDSASKVLGVCLFLLCTFSKTIVPQQYYTLTTEDGLPSNSVWRVTQDVEGRLWFGTTNGLARYDGENFVVKGSESGLLSESLTSLLWQNDTTLLVNSYRKGINVVNTNTLEVERTMMADRAGEHLLLHRGAFYDLLSGSSMITASWPELNFKYFRLEDKSNVSPLTIASHERGLLAIDKGELVIYDGGKRTLFCSEPSDSSFTTIFIKESRNWIGGVGYVAEFNDSGIFNKVVNGIPEDGKVHRIWENQNGQLLLSIVNYGLYLVDNGQAKAYGEHFGIGSIGINYFYEDRESNLWILTYGKGVICIPKRQIEQLDPGNILASSEINDFAYHDSLGMLVATSLGLFNIHESGVDSLPKFHAPNSPPSAGYGDTYLSRVDIKRNGDILVEIPGFPGTIGQVNYKGFNVNYERKWYFSKFDQKVISYKLEKEPIAAKVTIPERANEAVNAIALMYLDGLPIENYLSVPPPGSETYVDAQGRIWNEQENIGLCISTFIKDDKTNVKTETVLKDASFYCSIAFADKEFFGTSQGLYEFDGEYFYESELSSQLPDQVVKDMVLDSENRLWLATNSGLSCFRENQISTWNKSDGLNSNQINSVGYDPKKNLLYIGSDVGISMLNPSSFLSGSQKEIPIHFDEFSSRGVVFEDYENIDLSPGSNDVEISYSSLDYSKKEEKQFQYRLNGSVEKEWRNTTNTSIEFNSLQSDDYAFQVRPLLSNGELGKISTLNFSIDKVFYKKAWFYLLMTSLVFFSLWVYFNRRLKQQQKEQEKERAVEKKIKSLEYQALSAMMNPHFIFNSLNSIQYFYNSRDLRSANDYLAQFARLIRMNLDMADKATVELEDELDRLELYLQLEQMRLGDIFDYEINVDPLLEADGVLVPSMIIQPYVENSIFHGIRMNEAHGKIRINILPKPEDHITISIIDNGIGIIQSKAQKSKLNANHDSKAMRINEERINIIGQGDEQSRVDVEELVDAQGNILGTEVSIVIPDKFE